MIRLIVCAALLSLCACSNSKLVRYNVKTSIGNTEYDNGKRSFFTGASTDLQFDVK